MRLPEETKTNGQANRLEKEMFASIELESSVYARKCITSMYKLDLEDTTKTLLIPFQILQRSPLSDRGLAKPYSLRRIPTKLR